MPGALGHCPCELRTCLEEPAGHWSGCAGGGSATGAPAVLRVTWGEVWARTVSHICMRELKSWDLHSLSK